MQYQRRKRSTILAVGYCWRILLLSFSVLLVPAVVSQDSSSSLESPALSLLVRLPPLVEECFRIHITKPKILQGHFQLLSKSPEPPPDNALHVLLLDGQDDKALYEAKGRLHDNFQIELPSNNNNYGYWICLQNILPEGEGSNNNNNNNNSILSVEFSHALLPHPVASSTTTTMPATSPDEFVETSPHADEWKRLAEKVNSQMSEMKDFYGYVKARETKHRQVLEDTFSYVVAWNMTQLLVVFVVVCMQK